MKGDSERIDTIIPPVEKIKKGDTFELFGKKGTVTDVKYTTESLWGMRRGMVASEKTTSKIIITVEIINSESYRSEK